MFALTILLMAAAPTTHHVRAAHPARIVHHGRVARKARRPIIMTSRKLQVITARVEPRSPYRLPLEIAEGPTSKDLAVKQDGTRCALIGQTICPRRTHTIIRMGDELPGKAPTEAPH